MALLLLPRNMLGWPNLVMHVVMMLFLGSLVLREDALLAPVFRWTPVARIGAVSYGIYLLHLVVEHFAREVTLALHQPFGGGVYFLLYWGGTWACAELSFRFYESRFLALRHKPFGQVGRDHLPFKQTLTSKGPKA